MVCAFGIPINRAGPSRIQPNCQTSHVANDPVLIAYSVKRRSNAPAVWTRIGVAFPHEAGAGLTVVLDAAPLSRRIVLLEPDVTP